MKPIDIICVIEKTAPLAAAASWDASGVQVASDRETVTRVGVMLDPTLANVRQAVAEGADFLLAHHPLSMTPRFPNKADEYLAILALLFRNKAWLYSAHTSLDANPLGPVRWLAQELSLSGVRTLEPAAPAPEGFSAESSREERADLFRYGFGWTGVLPAPLPYAEFCGRLGAALGTKEWRACGARPATVARVACCPGSGSSLMEEARHAGADVYITGDVKYHAALDAESAGMRVLDVGHFCLEEEMMRRFAGQLQAELGVPVHFFPGRDPLEGERF